MPQRNASFPAAIEAYRNDYAAARASRFRRRRVGVPLSGSGADYHYRSDADYLRVMEYARDMDRNDCVIGQMVDRAVQNTVQEGFTPDPRTGDKMLDKDLTEYWWDWALDPEQCDAAGELSFPAMEELTLRSAFVDGDIFALATRDGALQLVEAHRCRTPSNTTQNVVHGILLDDRRRRLQIWITKDDIDPMWTVSRVSDVIRYDVRSPDGLRQVFQVWVSGKRASQTRGVTAFAPVFDVAGIFEDLQFAKLVQAQVTSCFAIFRKRTLEFSGSTTKQQGARETETQSDGTTRTVEGIAPGMEITGQPGEELTGFSPGVPNAEFFPHVKLVLTLIGVNLGLPLVMVLMDASETNFSGWRGAVDQARLGFRRNQRRLIERFHAQVWRWKVAQWIADSPAIAAVAKRDGIKIFAHDWHAPRWPYVQPLQDASADLLEVRNGLNSHRRRAAERSIDWDDLSTEIVEDNALAITKAKMRARDMNADLKDESERVHWRELISLPTPDGVTVQYSTSDDVDEPNRPKKVAA